MVDEEEEVKQGVGEEEVKGEEEEVKTAEKKSKFKRLLKGAK